MRAVVGCLDQRKYWENDLIWSFLPHFRLWIAFDLDHIPPLIPQLLCHLAGILLALVVPSTQHPGSNHVVISLAADVLLDELHVHLLQNIADMP